MARVLVQIGFSKSRKRSQSIEAFVNDLKLDWSDENGTWLTSFKDGKLRNMRWFLSEVDLEESDILRIAVTTFIPGVGKDEELTFESLYNVSEDLEVDEIYLNNVGMRGYPLIKGRVEEVASVSDDDKRKQEIEDFLNKGF